MKKKVMRCVDCIYFDDAMMYCHKFGYTAEEISGECVDEENTYPYDKERA